MQLLEWLGGWERSVYKEKLAIFTTVKVVMFVLNWPVVPEAPVCFSSLWTLTLHWSARWLKADRTPSSSWSSVCLSFGRDPPSHYTQNSRGAIKKMSIRATEVPAAQNTTPLTSWDLYPDAAGAVVWSQAPKDHTAPWTYRRSPERVSFQTGSQHYSRHLSSSCASSGCRCLLLAAPCVSEVLPDDCGRQRREEWTVKTAL